MKFYSSSKVFALALSLLAYQAQAHALMYHPQTRNYLAFQFGDGSGDINGYCPHCLNKDPYGGDWGSCGSEAARGGGVQSKGIVEGSYTHSDYTGAAGWKSTVVEVSNVYQAGDTIEVKTKQNAYHAGFYQLWLFTNPRAYDNEDIRLDLADGHNQLQKQIVHCTGDGSTPTVQAPQVGGKCCYYRRDGVLENEGAADYTECPGGLTYNQFVASGGSDDDFYSAWWLPGLTGEQGGVNGGAINDDDIGIYTFPVKIPSAQCSGTDRDGQPRCVLQWWWMSNNSCKGWKIPASESYVRNPSIPSSGMKWCDATPWEAKRPGEQFFNCADIRIEGGSGESPTPAPNAAPTEPPTPPVYCSEQDVAGCVADAIDECEMMTYVDTCACENEDYVRGPCGPSTCETYADGAVYEVVGGICQEVNRQALEDCQAREGVSNCRCERDDTGPCEVHECTAAFNLIDGVCRPEGWQPSDRCGICVRRFDTCWKTGVNPSDPWMMGETVGCRAHDGDENACMPAGYDNPDTWNQCMCISSDNRWTRDDSHWTASNDAYSIQANPCVEAAVTTPSPTAPTAAPTAPTAAPTAPTAAPTAPTAEPTNAPVAFQCYTAYKARGVSFGKAHAESLDECVQSCRDETGCEAVQFDSSKIGTSVKNCLRKGAETSGNAVTVHASVVQGGKAALTSCARAAETCYAE